MFFKRYVTVQRYTAIFEYVIYRARIDAMGKRQWWLYVQSVPDEAVVSTVWIIDYAAGAGAKSDSWKR